MTLLYLQVVLLIVYVLIVNMDLADVPGLLFQEIIIVTVMVQDYIVTGDLVGHVLLQDVPLAIQQLIQDVLPHQPPVQEEIVRVPVGQFREPVIEYNIQ